MSFTIADVVVQPLYVREAEGVYRLAVEEEVLSSARMILSQKIHTGKLMDSPAVVKEYLQLRIGTLEHEVFTVLFLDAQSRLIKIEDMFRGTNTQTSVYRREVVKAALSVNAAAVVLVHNHPSNGKAEPSRADEHLTDVLKQALVLVDVRVLDHIVVTAADTCSFAERGLL